MDPLIKLLLSCNKVKSYYLYRGGAVAYKRNIDTYIFGNG